MALDDNEGFLLARIVIERRLIGDEDCVRATFEDGDGEMPPLIELLGLLTMTVDTATKAAGGELGSGDDA